MPAASTRWPMPRAPARSRPSREQDQLGHLTALCGGEFDPIARHHLDAEQPTAAHHVALDSGLERRHARGEDARAPRRDDRGRLGHASSPGRLDQFSTNDDQFSSIGDQVWQEGLIPEDDDPETQAELKPLPRLDPRAFRDHLGCFPTGVTVITALGARGRRLGLTANSFNSVSLDPPMVLFSLDRRAGSLWDFLPTGHFAVNVLAEDQARLATRFARSQSDKWSDVAWASWDRGCPILEGCHATFECSIAYIYSGGDHVIFVGRVERMACDAAKMPLLYYRGSYHRLDAAEVTE